MPLTGAESWTVVGDDCAPLEPVERYLPHLAALERSPNTVRAYATSLSCGSSSSAEADDGWERAGVEDVARFVSWLRAPAGNVIVLDAGSGLRTPATVNRLMRRRRRGGPVLAGGAVAGSGGGSGRRRRAAVGGGRLRGKGGGRCGLVGGQVALLGGVCVHGCPSGGVGPVEPHWQSESRGGRGWQPVALRPPWISSVRAARSTVTARPEGGS